MANTSLKENIKLYLYHNLLTSINNANSPIIYFSYSRDYNVYTHRMLYWSREYKKNNG